MLVVFGTSRSRVDNFQRSLGRAMSQPPLDPRNDAELLAAHVAGDPESFGELFRRHQNRLWAVALRITRDPDEASDALQDAMISAFRRADTFRGNSKVSTWLHRIVVNSCLDQLRRKRSRPTVTMAERSETFTPDPRDPIGEHDTRMTVREALLQLPADQRSAVVLVDIEGWSVAGAAEILECPPGTVKSRCHRGRAKLAALLGNPERPEGVSGTDGDASKTSATEGRMASHDE